MSSETPKKYRVEVTTPGIPDSASEEFKQTFVGLDLPALIVYLNTAPALAAHRKKDLQPGAKLSQREG